MTKQVNAATIWIVTQDAIDAGEDVQYHAERLRDIFERGVKRPARNEWDGMACTPIAINIKIEDIDRAIAKWSDLVTDPARFVAIRHHKPSYDRYNTV